MRRLSWREFHRSYDKTCLQTRRLHACPPAVRCWCSLLLTVPVLLCCAHRRDKLFIMHVSDKSKTYLPPHLKPSYLKSDYEGGCRGAVVQCRHSLIHSPQPMHLPAELGCGIVFCNSLSFEPLGFAHSCCTSDTC